MNIENKATSQSREREHHDVIPVVRIFPVSPISLDAFAHAIDGDPELSDVSIVHAHLALQSDVDAPSSDRMTPFGGKIPEGRLIHEEALSRLEFDTTMVHHANELTGNFFSHAPLMDPFIHSVPGQSESRLAYCVVVPVRSSSFSAHVLRKNTERPDKKKDIYGVTPKELRNAFLTGMVQLEDGSAVPLLEHLTLMDNTFVLDSNNRTKRYLAIRDIMHEVERVDELWKAAIVREVNRTRRFYNMFTDTSLPYAELPVDCTKKELMCGFISAQMRASLYDEHLRDKEGNITPPKPADILKLPRILSVTPPEHILDVLVNVPTLPAFSGVQAFRKSVRPVVETMYTQLMEKPIPSTVDTYTALRTMWPRVLAMPLSDRVEFFTVINDQFTDIFAQYLGKPKMLIQQAYRVAQKYPDFIAENMQSLGPQFQEYRPMNEVTNTPMIHLLFLGLGFHPDVAVSKKDVKSSSMEMLRFESFRTLVLTLTAIEARVKKDSIKNTLFRSAMNTFVAFPPKVECIDIGNGIQHEVMHRTMEQSIGGAHIHLIIDERPAKSTESIMRKMYQSPEILDAHMINIALSDDNFGPDASFEDHLRLARAVSEALFFHLENELSGSGWVASVIPGTHKFQSYDRVKTYLSLSFFNREQYVESLRKGVRPGSEGDRIIREKYVVSIHKENEQEQIIEVNMYPIEQTARMADLTNSGFMGFEEKIIDDANGRYTAERWFVRDPKTPCTPSLYEQLYPPELYEQHMNRIKPHQRKKK
ncbi:MAG: hypothetical protein V1917_04460 [Candidatus Gottesmanbacteria bacterium]